MLSISVCGAANRVYVLTAPYATVADGVSELQWQRFWRGFRYGVPFGTLLADEETLADLDVLPGSYEAACRAAASSGFIKKHIPADILEIYCGR